MSTREVEAARKLLIRQLQGAYSGELAAGFAYRGHWRSVRELDQREAIAAIEADEWHHRELVGGLLAELGAGPHRAREAIMGTVGRALGALCHISGWFLPMYGAGLLESRNIAEYERAAHSAVECSRQDMIDCLLTMAEVEWDHEAYFRSHAASHRLASIVPLWSPVPARATIRAAFARGGL
ncbi:hypothetical protein BH20ACT2_BH20ACT2_08460 [soil metagenome]